MPLYVPACNQPQPRLQLQLQLGEDPDLKHANKMTKCHTVPKVLTLRIQPTYQPVDSKSASYVHTNTNKK